MSVVSKAALSVAFSLALGSSGFAHSRCGCPSSRTTTVTYGNSCQTVVNQSNGKTTITRTGDCSSSGLLYGVWRNSETEDAMADRLSAIEAFDKAADAYLAKGRKRTQEEFQSIMKTYTESLRSFSERMEHERESGYPHNYFDYGNGQVVYSADQKSEEAAKWFAGLAISAVLGAAGMGIIANRKRKKDAPGFAKPADPMRP